MPEQDADVLEVLIGKMGKDRDVDAVLRNRRYYPRYRRRRNKRSPPRPRRRCSRLALPLIRPIPQRCPLTPATLPSHAESVDVCARYGGHRLDFMRGSRSRRHQPKPWGSAGMSR